MQKYAVLRNLAPRRRGASPLESLGPRIATASVPKPQVEVHDLESNQVIDVVKDPQVQSVAPIMPTALIKPMEIGVSAANDAWGCSWQDWKMSCRRMLARGAKCACPPAHHQNLSRHGESNFATIFFEQKNSFRKETLVFCKS